MLKPRIRPVYTCMALTKTVNGAIKDGLKNGCTVTGSIKQGFVTMQDGDTKIYRALQKGNGQPWIVAFWNSERISWPIPEVPKGVSDTDDKRGLYGEHEDLAN